jgi:hypothetical protein
VFENVEIAPFKLEDLKSEENNIKLKSIQYPKVIIDFLDIQGPLDPNTMIEGITINDAPFTIASKNVPGPGKPDVINDVVFPAQKIYGPEIQLKKEDGGTIPIKLEYLEYPSVVIDTVNIPDPPPADIFLEPIVITEEKKVSGIVLDTPVTESAEEKDAKSAYIVPTLQIKDLNIPPEITFYPWDDGVEAHPEITIQLKDAPFTLEIQSIVVNQNPQSEVVIDNLNTTPLVIESVKTQIPSGSKERVLIPERNMEINVPINKDIGKNIKELLKNKNRTVPKIDIKNATIPVVVKKVIVPEENLNTINEQKKKKEEEQSTKNKNNVVKGDTSEPTAEQKRKVDEKKGSTTDEQKKVIAKSLGFRESGNNYKAVNQYGFVGKYQWGALSLNDLGMVKSNVRKNSQLKDPNSWSGKYGITSLEQFMNSPEVQEKVMRDWINLLEKRLRSQKIIDDTTSSSDIAGYIATSHLLGTGGAKKLKQGIVGKDANGTSAVEYFNIGKKSGYNQQLVGKNRFVNLNKDASSPSEEQKEEKKETQQSTNTTTKSETKKAVVKIEKPVVVTSTDPVTVNSKPPNDNEKKKLQNEVTRQKQQQKNAEKAQGKAKKKGEPDMDIPVNKKVQVTNKAWEKPSAVSVSKNRTVPVFKFGEKRPNKMQGSNHPGYISHGRLKDSATKSFHYWINKFVYDVKWNGSSFNMENADRPARIESKTSWYPWATDATFLKPTYSRPSEENYLKMMYDKQFNRWQDWKKLYNKPQPAIWDSGNGFQVGVLPYAFNANWDNLVSKFRINAFGLQNFPLSDEIKSKLSMMDVGIILNFQQSGIVNRYTVGDKQKTPPPAASGTEQHLMMVTELTGNWVLGKKGVDPMIGFFLPSSAAPNLNWAHEPHWCGIFSNYVSRKSGHSFRSPIEVRGYERDTLTAGLPLNRPRLEEDVNEEWDEDLWIQTVYAVRGGNLSKYATHTPWLIGMSKHPDNPEHPWDSDYISTYKNQINQIWFVENIHYVKNGKKGGSLTEWGKKLILGAIDQNIIDWPAAFATTYGHVEVCVGLDLDGTVYLFGGNSGGEGSDDVMGNKMGFWDKHIASFAPGIKAKNPWTGEGYDGGGHLCLSKMQGGHGKRQHPGISAPWVNTPIIETYKNYLVNNPDPKFPVYKTYLDRLLAINTIDAGLGLEVSTDLLY